jgi:hypothetical protein
MIKKIKKISKSLDRIRYISKAEGTPFTDTTHSNFLSKMLSILSQIRILHWQTKIFSEHTALGNYYDSLSYFLDGFVESFQGEFGTLEVSEVDTVIMNYEDVIKTFGSIQRYAENVSSLINSYYEKIPQSDNLKNQIDEITKHTNKLIYLLGLS